MRSLSASPTTRQTEHGCTVSSAANLSDLSEGAVFRAPYPFIRDTYDEIDMDGLGMVPTWRPGVRPEQCAPDDYELVADAMGEIILTVISSHKPGKYPTRVFFTRKWRDPDGKEFGKTACRIATVEKFRRLARGYGHEFSLKAQEEKAA